MRKIEVFKPVAGRGFLLILAGAVWFCVGAMLLFLSCRWLLKVDLAVGLACFGGGFAGGVAIHHFGFQKIADKNIKRILSKSGKQCVFSFFAWRSYILIAVMITMGRLLRHSEIPKEYLAVAYTAMGAALMLSSLKYLMALKCGDASGSFTSGESKSEE